MSYEHTLAHCLDQLYTLIKNTKLCMKHGEYNDDGTLYMIQTNLNRLIDFMPFLVSVIEQQKKECMDIERLNGLGELYIKIRHMQAAMDELCRMYDDIDKTR